MVYFSNLSINNLKNDVSQIKQDLTTFVKLNANNTFTGANTFTDTLTFKNASNNNGAFFTNLEYYGNVTSLKFVKNNSTALMILEVNNTNNTATISAPNATGGLHINNLANPVNADNATNKAYVDSKVVFIDKTNITFTRQEIEANKTYKYYTNSIPYTDIATGCTGIISIACSDIPVNGQHLVITYFPKRGGNNALIEIYQYNSSTDITTDLQRVHFQFVIQKSV